MTNNVSIIDSSALLAVIYNEDGIEEAQKKYFDHSYMSVINAAECLMILNKNGMPIDVAQNLLESIISKFIPTEYHDTPLIAQVKNENIPLELSLGDSTCIALGSKLGVNIITADKTWSEVRCKSKITCIR